MCGSSEEDLVESDTTTEKKVARSTSADSAVDLEESLKPGDFEPEKKTKRRNTLTVTDLPLRPALLPLAEPLALDNCCDRPFEEFDNFSGCSQCIVPSKTLLEAQLIELPIVPVDKDMQGSSTSRRESSQSCFSDGTYRILRTPSVVVSDYSDDVVCGITLEEIEYFRRHRLGRRFSSDGKGVDYDSDMSAASSCSNLNYCGSHISLLDGVEVDGGLKTPERKMSGSSTSGGEDDEPITPAVPAKKKVSFGENVE